jgi:putative mRNA 3-end processing factor
MLAQAGDLPGPVAVHGNGARLSDIYRAQGRPLAAAPAASPEVLRDLRGTGLLVCSPVGAGEAPLRHLGEVACALASGWTRIRGLRRQRAADRGFVISDHADWPGLLRAIEATGAARIGVTHGYTAPLVRYLRERGTDAFEFPTRYSGEPAETAAPGDTAPVEQPEPKKRDAQAELPFE